MDVLLQDLENAGLGLTAHPAPGDITIGGALAIDGHGTAVPAQGETIIPGHTYGSVSNLILSLTAVVWSASQGQYVLQTFERSDPAIQPLLAHLGRTFVTEVTLQVGANTRLRCQSFVNVPASALFGAPGSSSQTFDCVRGAVRPGGDDLVPLHVRAVAEGVDDRTSEASVVARGRRSPTTTSLPTSSLRRSPGSSKRSWRVTSASHRHSAKPSSPSSPLGSLGTLTADIWGWAKDLLLYVKPSTLRVTANGYAVLTSRANIQQVIYDFITFYENQVAAYQAEGNYPMNGPVEIRVTGLDVPGDVRSPPQRRPSCRRCVRGPINPNGTWPCGSTSSPCPGPRTRISSTGRSNSGCSLTTSARMPRSVPNGPRDGPTPTRRLGPIPPC